MVNRGIHIYVGAVCLAAVVLLSHLDWSTLYQLPTTEWWGLAALIFLGLVSESLAISFKVGGSSGQASITFLPLLAGMVIFGTPSTVVFIVTTGVIGEFLIRRKPPIRAFFNNAQWIVSTIAGGWVFSELGGVPLYLPGSELRLVLRPFVGFTLVFLALNHSAVALAISLNQGEPFRKVLSGVLGPTGTNLLYDLLVSPLALGVAILYERVAAFGLVMSLLPLLFIRSSYLTKLRFQQANRDLLKALVKAIETRDPYTSGHSLRVSGLARRIAAALGLSSRRTDAIATAALLHDVGKIDAVYTEILRKPESLSAEERRVIESHVTKGVELLTSLSSFSNEVITAVRYHHEREDGRGYPDGLKGDEIPLGAKIIKVCDAIDAMLSDRPYRSALSLQQVKEQLITYAGIQFDEGVVRCVAESSVLEDHQRDMSSHRTGVETETAQASQEVAMGDNPLSHISRWGRRLVGRQT